MSKEVLTPTALIYKGKLFQIGDLIKSNVEYLGPTGFNRYNTGGRLTRIEVSVGTLGNSLYLNHGMTYNAIEGLSYRFIFAKKHYVMGKEEESSEYGFESDMVPFPSRVKDIDDFLTAYYNHFINKDKLEHLLVFLNMDKTKQYNKLGYILRQSHNELWKYICLTFRIRGGQFGTITSGTEMSNITMRELKKIGYNNRTDNLLWKFTSDNSYIKNEQGQRIKAVYKSLMLEEQKQYLLK